MAYTTIEKVLDQVASAAGLAQELGIKEVISLAKRRTYMEKKSAEAWLHRLNFASRPKDSPPPQDADQIAEGAFRRLNEAAWTYQAERSVLRH